MPAPALSYPAQADPNSVISRVSVLSGAFISERSVAVSELLMHGLERRYSPNTSPRLAILFLQCRGLMCLSARPPVSLGYALFAQRLLSAHRQPKSSGHPCSQISVDEGQVTFQRALLNEALDALA
jgi:hypothetical protein